MVGLCNNSSIVNKERNKQMSDRITYVMIRLDEATVNPNMVAQDMVRNVDGAVIYQSKQITAKDEEDIGGPVIYFP